MNAQTASALLPAVLLCTIILSHDSSTIHQASATCFMAFAAGYSLLARNRFFTTPGFDDDHAECEDDPVTTTITTINLTPSSALSTLAAFSGAACIPSAILSVIAKLS